MFIIIIPVIHLWLKQFLILHKPKKANSSQLKKNKLF